MPILPLLALLACGPAETPAEAPAPTPEPAEAAAPKHAALFAVLPEGLASVAELRNATGWMITCRRVDAAQTLLSMLESRDGTHSPSSPKR